MSKIRFNCPTCLAKLKVPAKLAGISGPCPNCGGTIVAPMFPEIPVEEPAAAAAASPAPNGNKNGNKNNKNGNGKCKGPGKGQGRGKGKGAGKKANRHPAPAANIPAPRGPARMPDWGSPSSPEEPAVAAVGQPSPGQGSADPQTLPAPVDPVMAEVPLSPPVSEQGFPRPLEQVSQTAAVALANAPQPQVDVSLPPLPDAATETAVPEAPSRAVVELELSAAEQNTLPEDLFSDTPRSKSPGQSHAATPPPGSSPNYFPPVSQHRTHSENTVPLSPNPGQQTPDQSQEGSVPKTQPIVVKRKTDPMPSEEVQERLERDLPRLDVSLAGSGSEPLSLQTGSSENQGPTRVQLPELGSEKEEFQISPPKSQTGSYSPPTPVALSPPGGEPVQELPEPENFAGPENGTGTGDGSVAALLASASGSNASHTPVSEVPLEDEPVLVPDHLQEPRSKDEILDELLGAAPKSKKVRKKGLSKTAVLMISILSAVAVCAAAGIYFAVEKKLGGFIVSDENIHGERGQKALEARKGIPFPAKSGNTPPQAIVLDLNTGNKSPVMTTEGGELPEVDDSAEATLPSTPPDKIEVPDVETTVEEAIESVVDAGADAINEGATNLADVGNDTAEKLDEIVSNTSDALIAQPVEPIQDPENPASLSSTADLSAETSGKKWNPPASFRAPGPDDPLLFNTHELADAFLSAPSWKDRIAYSHSGQSLAPAMAEYYKKWPDFSLENYSIQYFLMEDDPEFGGPFWIYSVFENSNDNAGAPLIIRVEDGNLKADWESYSEFRDQHFLKFRDGEINAPASFRLVLERVEKYPGSDREGFTDVDQYLCYALNPPYGKPGEFTEYAFVKKGTQLAAEMDNAVGPGSQPLAAIVTLDRKPFSHGVKNLVITKFSEGWY